MLQIPPPHPIKGGDEGAVCVSDYMVAAGPETMILWYLDSVSLLLKW